MGRQKDSRAEILDSWVVEILYAASRSLVAVQCSIISRQKRRYNLPLVAFLLQFKTLGDNAYKAGKIDDAIQSYSEALNIDDTNVVCYSNRSAAYLKKGEAESALGDAESCLKLDPNFIKGYSRKAAALQATKRYKEAADALKAGLEKDPDNELLAQELKSVLQEQKLISSTRARRASVIASQSSKKKAGEAESISDFVKMTRFALEFEIAAKQAQLMLLNSLAEKSDEEKLKMLFSILDKDGDGFIDARELSDGVRKNNEDFTFAESLDRAIDLVVSAVMNNGLFGVQ